MSSPYQPGIPTGTVNLDVDYKNLQNNFLQLNNIYGVDHLPFSNNTTEKGFHTTLHMQPASGTPSPVANTGEFYCKTVNDGIATDQVFYFQTGDGKELQMTRNFVPQLSANGYTFLPGGLIFQWGVANTSAITGIATVVFPQPMTVFYSGSLTRQETGGTNRGFVQYNATPTNTAFQAIMRDATGTILGGKFYWTAIGR